MSGDFNFCALDPPDFAHLSSTTEPFQLLQLIQEPTHLKRAIDLVFVGQSVPVHQCGISPPVEKNHASVWVQLHGLPGNTAPCRRILSWRWSEADWPRAYFLLNYLPHGSPRSLAADALSLPSVADSVDFLNTTLRSVLFQCVPHRERAVKCSPVPWFSAKIARLLKKRDRAFAFFRKSQNPTTLAKFKQCRKTVKVEIRQAKNQYLEGTFQDVQNPSDFWRAVRRATGAPTQLPTLERPNGQFAIDPSEKAELLSYFFASTFNRQDCLPPLFEAGNVTDPKWRCTAQFVLKHLRQLPWSAHAGLDAMPCYLLRACADSLAEPVAAICNRCLTDGEFPAAWKAARVAAVPKSSGVACAENCRPISVLPVLARIAERWLLSILSPYVQLSPFQFGNLRGRSTEDALAFLQYSVAQGFAACQGSATKVAAISVDVRKAFDTVPHNALLTHLLQLGIPPMLVRLLKHYLAYRTQVVKVDSAFSHPVEVRSGVVQGSVLGPFLFSVYVDKILRLPLSKYTVPIMYVDDLIVL